MWHFFFVTLCHPFGFCFECAIFSLWRCHILLVLFFECDTFSFWRCDFLPLELLFIVGCFFFYSFVSSFLMLKLWFMNLCTRALDTLFKQSWFMNYFTNWTYFFENLVLTNPILLCTLLFVTETRKLKKKNMKPHTNVSFILSFLFIRVIEVF